MKKRANGKGSAIYLGDNRDKPWAARITIGKDINGIAVRYFIGTFRSQLEALVCLENYHNAPSPLYINEKKYNRIVTFPQKPYPLISVKNPKKDLIEKVKKDNYTFKQLFEKFREVKMLTKEEEQLEKTYHIRPTNKPFGRHYCRGMISAYHNSEALYDKVYKDLRATDFMNHLKNCNKGPEPQKQMINLFTNLDKFALEEDIITKGYAQFITITTTNRKEIKKSKNIKVKNDRLFSYDQINYLWNFTPRTTGLKANTKKEREQFIRDFWLMLIYSGCRADELLSIYTENVFLDEHYFIGGLKTAAGINREIPIHPSIEHLFKKYYNPNNEFLFMQPNGKKIDYDYYLYHYKFNFKKLHPEVSMHTAHDARHTLRNELRKLNVKDIIINSIIGHSNDDVGEDIYSHIDVKEKLEAINLVTYKDKPKLFIFNSNKLENAN